MEAREEATWEARRGAAEAPARRRRLPPQRRRRRCVLVARASCRGLGVRAGHGAAAAAADHDWAAPNLALSVSPAPPAGPGPMRVPAFVATVVCPGGGLVTLRRALSKGEAAAVRSARRPSARSPQAAPVAARALAAMPAANEWGAPAGGGRRQGRSSLCAVVRPCACCSRHVRGRVQSGTSPEAHREVTGHAPPKRSAVSWSAAARVTATAQSAVLFSYRRAPAVGGSTPGGGG